MEKKYIKQKGQYILLFSHTNYFQEQYMRNFDMPLQSGTSIEEQARYMENMGIYVA